MAIDTEFIDFIVPIAVIKEKYPGGWAQCLEDHGGLLGGRVWHDDYLFRDGAMNPIDIKSKVERWKAMGFEPFREVNGKRQSADFCVYEEMFGESTLECPWLVSAKRYSVAHIDDPHPEVVKHLPARDLEPIVESKVHGIPGYDRSDIDRPLTAEERKRRSERLKSFLDDES